MSLLGTSLEEEMNKESGFSLVETMMAMVVLMVGLLGLIGLFETGTMALDSGRKQTIATQWAIEKMEQLRYLPPVHLSNGQDTPVMGMDRRWTIKQSNQYPNILIVQVDVAWKSLGGPGRTATLKNFVFR